MIMSSLSPINCCFLKPKIVDTWKLNVGHKLAESQMFKILIAQTKYHSPRLDLYTLVAVNVSSENGQYTYNAINYEENYASCRYYAEYYGIALPPEYASETQKLAINEMMKIMKKNKNERSDKNGNK